ncbi:DUF1450 domain-containing protein [Anoxybacteroides tepidamans]|uniref:DUF1450 domain-containing protein n=1 Tax=Anoxybacteroides tepidamans TaxID=265948 RepID=UPI00048927BC|nr:DUF1450 domain-containing protein [Anoxybacillus tepidamans]
MKKICFCKKNKFETKKLYLFLKGTYKNVKIKRKDCLGNCKTCKSCPFVLIDKEMVKCLTVDELYNEMNERLVEDWRRFRAK